MDTPSGGGRDSRFSMGYNMSLLSGETAPEIYTSSVHSRPSTSITSGLSRSSLSLSSGCGAGLQRGIKRTSSDVCFDQDVSGGRSGISSMTGDCGSDIVDDHGFSSTPQKGSPPSNGKKTKGRVKIKMEYIDNKLRRYTTFSKRKTGIMKKAYELSTLTGTQVMLLVASETGHVYTFATRKLQPMITSEAGKALIQTCLNSPDPCPSGSGGDQRMSATGFEETELSYNIGDEEQKEEVTSEGAASGAESSSCGSPEPPGGRDLSTGSRPTGRGSPPPACPVALISAVPAHQNNRIPTTSIAGGGPGFPVLYHNPGLAHTQSGMVYASPGPGMPNGGVIFSLGSEAPGRGHFVIPLPLTVPTANPSTTQQPADLTKSKK